MKFFGKFQLNKEKVMNKTVKTILQVISYIISILLGAAGGSMIG